jgi:hypothetical protein
MQLDRLLEGSAMSEVLAKCPAEPSKVLRPLNCSTDSAKAADLFWADLPGKLEKSEYFGRWVAYTVQGCFHVAKEHEDDQAVHRYCRGCGLMPEQYFVGRVVPDQAITEITDNWTPG